MTPTPPGIARFHQDENRAEVTFSNPSKEDWVKLMVMATVHGVALRMNEKQRRGQIKIVITFTPNEDLAKEDSHA